MDDNGNEVVKTETVERLKDQFLLGFNTYESWSYDGKTNKFRKSVIGIVPLYYDETKELFSGTSMFIPLTAADEKEIVNDSYLLVKDVCYERMINRQDFESDGMLYYGAPTIYNNIAIEKRFGLMQSLLNSALARKARVFNSITGEKIKPKYLPVLIEHFNSANKMVSDLPTAYMYINCLRFTEDWYYNPAKRQLYKKVRSIALLNRTDSYSDDMSVSTMEKKELFTIKFK